MRPFQDPSAKVAEAKERVLKLETALAAMEGMEGPEVDLVRAAHKRAQEAVKGVPVDVQIKECESFLARARTHLEELDMKRATVSQNIEMSEKRLAELKALAQVAPAPQDNAAEVQQLRGLVSQLQTQIDSAQVQPWTVVQMVQCRRGRAVEKNLFLRAARRWRSGWRGDTKIFKLPWSQENSPRLRGSLS